MELPFDDLRRYCGCPNEEESNECTICPGGEIVLDQSGVNTFINVGSDDRVSCEKAQTLAAQTEKGTDICNQIQSISTVYGCPVPDNACRLCKNREELAATGTLITTPGGENVRCELVEAQLHDFKSSSIECTSLDESYADECGCSEPETSVPGSLCVGGEDVPFPKKEIKDFYDAAYLLEANCGKVSTLALLLHENSLTCRRTRGLAQLCGCKPRAENTCTLCRSGDTMSNPFQIRMVTLTSHAKSLIRFFPIGTQRMIAYVIGISW